MAQDLTLGCAKQWVLQILRGGINTCHTVHFNEKLLFSAGFSRCVARPQGKVYCTRALPAAYKFFFLLGREGPIKLSRVFIMGGGQYMLLYHNLASSPPPHSCSPPFISPLHPSMFSAASSAVPYLFCRAHNFIFVLFVCVCLRAPVMTLE